VRADVTGTAGHQDAHADRLEYRGSDLTEQAVNRDGRVIGVRADAFAIGQNAKLVQDLAERS